LSKPFSQNALNQFAIGIARPINKLLPAGGLKSNAEFQKASNCGIFFHNRAEPTYLKTDMDENWIVQLHGHMQAA